MCVCVCVCVCVCAWGWGGGGGAYVCAGSVYEEYNIVCIYHLRGFMNTFLLTCKAR